MYGRFNLWADHSLWPTSVTTAPYSPTVIQGGNDNFGWDVAFIGDINADGYDDIGIGAPYGDWDGQAAPAAPGSSGFVVNAGYVAIFFGSRYGLGHETPTATGVPSPADPKFSLVKSLCSYGGALICFLVYPLPVVLMRMDTILFIMPLMVSTMVDLDFVVGAF